MPKPDSSIGGRLGVVAVRSEIHATHPSIQIEPVAARDRKNAEVETRQRQADGFRLTRGSVRSAGEDRSCRSEVGASNGETEVSGRSA